MVFGTQKSTKTRRVNKLKFKKIPFEETPLAIFSKLHRKYKKAYILESMEGPKKLAEFSFIGFDPKVSIKIKNGNVTILNEETKEEHIEKSKEPLKKLQKLLISETVFNNKFRLVGGAVGYISYDAIRYWENLPNKAKNDLDFPDIQLGIFDDGIVFDHKQKQAFYYYQNDNRISEIKKYFNKKNELQSLNFSEPKLNITKEKFEKAVMKAKEYINSGDIFQVVLSKRYEFTIKGNLLAFYNCLRQINPSPYMYFLKEGEKQIIGSSPEMLVRVDRRMIKTFPIAGTRPCTDNSKKNSQLAKELLADPKERAEHVMLVDLARNDIGRIAKFGSVRVPEFMTVHKYSHVQHIVSQVSGELSNNYESYDALRAVFPAGTVSGAPKIRAMEIIDELEPTRRGPYAGAVGYFSYNGNSDFAITIRTLFANKNKAYIQVGAGIVADSIPEREWFETNHKAEALMKALKHCGDRNIESVSHR
ncbi:anthranilate synthase component I [Candidatus Bathyarchaeota archaeon]|nr:anthranilate synthase component I [Candidatus Bathyarchaeota archaeon]